MSDCKTEGDFKIVSMCDLEAIDPYHEVEECIRCFRGETSYFWADTKGNLLLLRDGSVILAPRPDGKCYCGETREDCGNFSVYGKDCQGFTSTRDVENLNMYISQQKTREYSY